MPPAPTTTVHIAQSLDGRLAIEGARTLLSTTEGVHAAHLARACHDAVLVGINTVRVDDPQLSVRASAGKNPLRVVLASRLDLPAAARVIGTDGRLLVIGAKGRATDEAILALRKHKKIDVAVVDATTDGMVALDAALEVLRERGVEKLLVEGGARVLTSFFRASLVDAVEIEIAMKFLGAPGTSTLGALGISGVDEAIALTETSVDRLGENLLLRGRVVKKRVRGT